jgi:hypothetical protein
MLTGGAAALTENKTRNFMGTPLESPAC